MTRKTIARIAGTAVATGLAGLSFAAPATAMQVGDPGQGATVQPSGGSTSTDDPWMEITLGALGGLVLAGAGVAAASGVRHRQTATTS
jgi:hypothetical protein